ncbi:ribosomal protein S18-alanine N-acetyltransferase [Sulfurisoma sediminicola]|uniref:[Ribosomal protein bS18]-alanine N-acetyltransferase n=1 Tax=Sulfurisoma sediminicola TaxID=1381557 RepID=A0A497XCW4_9PROT|nr:ribosomal protein S18-alanine N-acetyltransferase [Sulfurisoma sediminicola]RLJ64812.1 ribosomal-protein-alanine N-acetyltransferase [Sulfurisoma sediminicola]
MSAVLAAVVDFLPMRSDDIDAVVAAEQRIYDFPWTHGNFTDSLAAGYSAWLLQEDGRMVGYAVMMLVVDEAHLLNLSILPEAQRRGLGSRLLRHLFVIARGKGATRVLLEVRPSNACGLGLYRRFGFLTIGERRGYYQAHQGRESALVMALDL